MIYMKRQKSDACGAPFIGNRLPAIRAKPRATMGHPRKGRCEPRTATMVRDAQGG